jgi:hypothetical protein
VNNLTTYNHTIHTTDDSVFAIITVDGEIKVATDDNPQIDEIVELLRAAEAAKARKKNSSELYAKAFALFDVRSAVVSAYETLSDRIKVGNDDHVYFDGDRLPEVIENIIIRSLHEKNGGHVSVVNFIEKVYSNVSEHVREHLFSWLMQEDFSITTNGDIVAYKGLTRDLGSISRGPAVVDGKPVNGSVPNLPGSVVEIKRSDVVADPRRGCAFGLHAGTYGYASGFAQGALVEVHINPRDVVSVPTDCSSQKMRVSRYRVIQEVTGKYSQSIVPSYAEEDDDFSVEYDDSIPVY